MNKEELRVGNIISFEHTAHIVVGIHSDKVLHSWINGGSYFSDYENIEGFPITDKWLLRLGFRKEAKPSYINGFKYTFQVDGYWGESIDRDGTWFDGIGNYEWKSKGHLSVSTLCRGNYAANSVQYVHELQNLYFALKGKELEIKTELNPTP